jgi:hypothetical protein
MTYRFRWLACLSVGALVITGCSSTSGPSGPAAQNDGAAANQDSGSGGGMDAPAQMCTAVSLTPMAGAASFSCFNCQATKCASEMAACASDCACGPAYVCLEGHADMGLNAAYSMCQDTALAAVSNGNQAIMTLAACATNKCNAECFGDGG